MATITEATHFLGAKFNQSVPMNTDMS